MKLLKIILTVLVLGGLTASLLSCGSESDEAIPENQIITMQRGNLTIDITAAGNLALSHTEDLAIDLFYQEGTIEEVLVEEGDIVAEGQVLVKLDTDEWEDELSALVDRTTVEERALLQAQINLQTAGQNLKNARDNEAVKELALLNAQISLDTAVYNLRGAISAIDYDAVEADLNKAIAWYEYLEDKLQEATSNIDDLLLSLENAKDNLDTAQANYDNVLAGYDSETVAIKKKQIEAAEMSLASAQEDIADVTKDVALKELLATLNQGKLKDAQKALADAQEELEEAQSKSPEITAPFAGFITTVNVEGGDEVLKGTVAVQLADPKNFEADILVSEMDILQVKLEGEAWVQVDAMQGMSLPAKVTHISPTATIQSGVVNYEVKVEIQSLEAAMEERHQAMQETMADIAAGQLPAPLQQAIDEGRLTREEAEEMIKQRQAEMGGQAGQGQISQVPSMAPEDFQLREGLTVTVSILIDERIDVLLVPNAAITGKEGQSYVQVVSPDGTTEERTIQTGISDWQFTEVTDGLGEGEQVIVPQGTAASPTTSPQRPRGPMPFMGPPH